MRALYVRCPNASSIVSHRLQLCINTDTSRVMSARRPVVFLGNSRERLRDFPEDARRDAGFELGRVQEGYDPIDWKPMPTIGKGVREIRVSDRRGEFRVIYVASIGAMIYVLHAFHKKTQKTPQRDVALATARFREIAKE